MAPDQDIDLPFALRSGDVVGGYTIVRVIGYGGFGITYRAHNRVTLKQVAIKEFFPVGLVHRDGNSRLIYSQVEADTITWALNKFEMTTTTLCGLTHPNIVQVYDYLSTNATGYMIMELLEGQTLADWLKNRAARPSLPEVRPVVEPVMDALCYLHENGLIHRDIAPDNIFVTSTGRPVLIDFGSVSRQVSAVLHQARGTRGVVKAGYTAPEQALAEVQPTPEGDVYSMGAVLYTALTGARPADGSARKDELFHGRPDPYQPMADRCPDGCPDEAARMIDKALSLRPESRFRSIAELRDGMKVHPVPLEPKRMSASPEPEVADPARAGGLLGPVPSHHRRKLLVAGAGAAVIVLVLVGPWLVFGTPAPPVPSPVVAPAEDGGADAADAAPPDDEPAANAHTHKRQRGSHHKAK